MYISGKFPIPMLHTIQLVRKLLQLCVSYCVGGSDYTPVNSGSITIDIVQSVFPNTTVSITDDSEVENDEIFFINFTGCSPGCMVSSASDTVIVTMESDDGK